MWRRLRNPQLRTPMRSPLRFALLALALVLFLGGPSLLRFYTDWLWFSEVGYQAVFLTILRSQGALFTLTFIAATAWLVVNLNVALSAIGNVRPVFTTREGLQVTLPGGRQLRSLALGAALLLAALIGLFFAGRWEQWLAWRFGVPFGVQDPILGRDVAFYVFSLPFLRLVQRVAQALVVLAAVSTAAIYLVSGHPHVRVPREALSVARCASAPDSPRSRLLPAAGVGRLASTGRATGRVIRVRYTGPATLTSTAECRWR